MLISRCLSGNGGWLSGRMLADSIAALSEYGGEAALHGFWGVTSVYFNIAGFSSDFRLWRYRGFRCTVNGESGEAHERGHRGVWLQRGQPLSLQYPWEKVAMCERSATSTVIDGTRPNLDRKLLRSSRTGCHVLPAWTARTGSLS